MASSNDCYSIDVRRWIRWESQRAAMRGRCSVAWCWSRRGWQTEQSQQLCWTTWGCLAALSGSSTRHTRHVTQEPRSRSRSRSQHHIHRWPTWNDLPEDVTSAESLATFRRLLKTHLFRKSFPNYTLDINWLSPVDLAVVPLLRPPKKLFVWLIDWLIDQPSFTTSSDSQLALVYHRDQLMSAVTWL